MKTKKYIQRAREMVQKKEYGKRTLGAAMFALGLALALLFSGGESVQYSSEANILSSSKNNVNQQKEDSLSLGEPKNEEKKGEQKEEILSWTEEVRKEPKRPRIGLTDRMSDDEIAATFSSLWGAVDDNITEEQELPPLPEREQKEVYDITKKYAPVTSIDAAKREKTEILLKGKEEKKTPQKRIVHTPSFSSSSATKKKENIPKKTPPPSSAPKKKTHKSSHCKDGTYSAVGNYKTRSGKSESISVRLTLIDGRIAQMSVMPLAQEKEERTMQATFAKDVVAYVQGERIDAVPVFAAVDGKSFVPKGFQRAIAAIRKQAQQ